MQCSVSESGSIGLRHGSPDPDPHQNVMDPFRNTANMTILMSGATGPDPFESELVIVTIFVIVFS
jgi:hypothetical protein